MNWKVEMTSLAEKEFRALVRMRVLNADDLKVIRSWLDDMEEEGPEFIQRSSLWDDHPLHGKWVGFRASCFSPAGRIIYSIRQNSIVVEVFRITPDHDYSRE